MTETNGEHFGWWLYIVEVGYSNILQLYPAIIKINSCLRPYHTIYMGASLNGGTPISHPKMIICSRKTHGCWGNPPFWGNPHIVTGRLASHFFDLVWPRIMQKVHQVNLRKGPWAPCANGGQLSFSNLGWSSHLEIYVGYLNSEWPATNIS